LQPAPSHLQVLLLSTAICTVPLLSGCALLPENSVRATIEETSVEHIPENTAIKATETLIAEVYSEQSVIVSDQIKPAEKPIPLVIEEIAEPEPMDLWQRIREGYNLTPESMPASVTKQRDCICVIQVT
jgi:hypothetical protein